MGKNCHIHRNHIYKFTNAVRTYSSANHLFLLIHGSYTNNEKEKYSHTNISTQNNRQPKSVYEYER